MAGQKISRRKFVVRSILGGSGVLLGAVFLGRNSIRRSIYDVAESPESLRYIGNTSDPTLWFELTSDSRLILFSPKVEMGQGVFTGMAQLVAEELEVDFNAIEVKHAESKSGNIDGLSTGGSTSIAGFWQPLRELAATMRELLRIEGAKKMGSDLEKTIVKSGRVISGTKSLSFGEVVDGVTDWQIPDTPELKPQKEFKVIGKPLERVDLLAKVLGKPIFGMDAELPNMLYGSIVYPDKIASKFKSANTSEVENMPGVIKVVIEDDFVGVVAKSYMQAEQAKQRIKVEWATEGEWNSADIEEAIKVGKGKRMIVQKVGDVSGIFDSTGSEDIITAEYTSPIGAHAQMEPNGALAYVDGDKAEVIISTQVVKLTRKEVAERLGLDEENVNIIPTYLGGGFGRRLHTPHAVQIALLSKAVGKPVKCFMNRKEEFQKDTFRPPTHHSLRAKLKSDGFIEAIEHNYATGDVMFNSALLPGFVSALAGSDLGAMRGGRIQYSGVPHYRAISWHSELPFATSWWRSLGLLANTFAIESFIDELAEKAGKDPISFRLAQIGDDETGRRLKKVIETVRDRASYQNEIKGKKAMGFACSTDSGTPCAQVVEVSREGDQIRVERVFCAIDPGLAINPDQVRSQCEGAICMGISASMYEEMFVEKNELRPIIYGPYRMALMRNSPKDIVVDIIDGTGIPGAMGEPPLGPVGAAIANAIYRLTGERRREMPLG